MTAARAVALALQRHGRRDTAAVAGVYGLARSLNLFSPFDHQKE
jgi:hypothetical protein